MSFLIDTCVVSELRKPQPAPAVLSWFEAVPESLLWICGVTLGELRYGVSRLPAGRTRNSLQIWYEELCESFSRQTVGCSLEAFIRWGELRAHREHVGKTLPMVDGLLAAIALEGCFTLVTRNIGDFEELGVEVLNPWLTE